MQQQELPLAEAEGIAAERRSTLENAIACARRREGRTVDAEFVLFVRWVYAESQAGATGHVGYEDLAERVLGWCSKSKARSTVALARRLGIVSVADDGAGGGPQRPPSYRVDWHGVQSILGVAARASPEHARASGKHACPPIGTLPRARPGAPVGSGTETETETDTGSVSVSVSETDGPVRLTAAMLAECPEWTEGSLRPVEPLAPGRLIYGCFKPLLWKHLTDPVTMVRWFRQQCGLREPLRLLDPHEGALLLVLAAAEHAVQERGVRSPPAFFASTVGRGIWRPVLHRMTRARERTDQLLAEAPWLLRGPWPSREPVEREAEAK